MKEFEPDNVRKVLRELGMAEGRIFDRALLDQRRAGAQAPVPVARPVRRRGADHRHAARAQPRRHQHRRDRRRGGQDPRHQHRRRQAFSESELLGLFVLRTPGWLTWYTKHDRYSREQLAADLETLRSLLPQPRLPRLQHRVDPGLDHARPARHLHHHQHHRGREVHRVGREARRAAAAAARGAARLVQLKPGDVFSREKLAEHQGDLRPPRQRGLRLRQRQRDPERRQGKAHRRLHHRRSTRAGACTCGASTSPATPRRATRWCAARCASSRARSTTPRRSSCRAGASTAPATSARSSVETPSRWTGTPDQVDVTLQVKEKPTGALLLGVGLLQRGS